MKVLISAYTCDPFGGSEGANAWFTAEGLARAGAHVHIITREADRLKVEAGLAQLEPFPAGGLTVSYLSDAIPRALAGGQARVYARYATWQWRCHRWATLPHQPPWDIAQHVSWGSLSHPIGLAGTGIPLVLGPVGGGQRLHTGLAHWLDGPKRGDRLRNLALARVPRNPLARRAAADSHLVLATNQETATLADRLGARRVTLALAEGVREGQLARTLPPFPKDPSIVWIGRFLPLKAAGLAVAAFRLVRQVLPHARLFLVGDGPTRAAVQEGARDLEEQGSIAFLGALPWGDAQEALGRARVHLFTSIRDSSSAQTLEAAAAGVPTVALDAHAARTFLCGPGFRLVDPFPSAWLDRRFAEALIELLQCDPDQWALESEGALEFARGQTYRERSSAMLETYRELLHAGSRWPSRRLPDPYAGAQQ